MNTVIDTYSRLAEVYDLPRNVDSCWGRVTRECVEAVRIAPGYATVADVGCGTGRELARLASLAPAGVRFFGVEPAANMRAIASARTATYPNVSVVDGRFECLPFASGSIDYLYSILAFHWTTDAAASVAELARVIRPGGDMDLTFIGRHNGREFIRKTTPIFFRYLTPASIVKAVLLRQQLTVEAAAALFGSAFGDSGLAVTESYHTYHDSLDAHWGWWVRIEAQFLDIPPERRTECDREIRAALSTLAEPNGIPYTVHLLHVRRRALPAPDGGP